MTYTEQQKQALSRKVAEKHGIRSFKLLTVFEGDSEEQGVLQHSPEELWLHDDWHTIMELCVKHGVWAVHDKNMQYLEDSVIATIQNMDGTAGVQIVTEYTDCNNDPSEAERIARLLALGEI